VDNTRDYARVSHSRQWSNYNLVVGISALSPDSPINISGFGYQYHVPSSAVSRSEWRSLAESCVYSCLLFGASFWYKFLERM